MKYAHIITSVIRIFLLRIKGVNVSWKARISWQAEISPMGGEISIGDGTFIDKGAILRAYGGKIIIGRMCSVNPYCVLYGHGGLIIKDGVRIAAQSIFIPANHIFSDPNIPIYLQGETMNGILIEEDVWIGSGVRVLDGVNIGKGSVIAAGSVVAKTLQPLGVYSGMPAKKINTR